MRTSTYIQSNLLEAFLTFRKMIRFSKFRRSGFKFEDLTRLRFHLRMLNYRMLKPNNNTCLKCKYKLKQIIIREKMLQLIKNAFLENWI